MKILTVCERNNNRSVVLASILREERGERDVISCGTQTFSPETLNMLCQWADKIVLVDEILKYQFPFDPYINKVVIIPIGQDRWGYSHNSDLQDLIREMLDKTIYEK